MAPQSKLQMIQATCINFIFRDRPGRSFLGVHSVAWPSCLRQQVSLSAAPPAEARQVTYYGSFFQGWLQTPEQPYRSRRHERAPDRRPVERRPVGGTPRSKRRLRERSPAVRSTRSCLSPISISHSTMRTACGNAAWSRQAWLAIQRRLASLPSSRRSAGIGRTSTAAHPCPTCSASPGRVLQCMKGW